MLLEGGPEFQRKFRLKQAIVTSTTKSLTNQPNPTQPNPTQPNQVSIINNKEMDLINTTLLHYSSHAITRQLRLHSTNRLLILLRVYLGSTYSLLKSIDSKIH